MAEQIFRSPGFFEREIDLTQRTREIEGVPAGIIGMSDKGPAFVPVTVGSFVDFERKFGTLNTDFFGPYAVNEWLKHRTALTYIRVLGAGSNSSTTDISATQTKGTVKNAGFVIKGTNEVTAIDSFTRHKGAVQFLGGLHSAQTEYEVPGYPLFSDNDSFDTATYLRLVRAMIFTATGSRVEVLNHSSSYRATSPNETDTATISSYDGTQSQGMFKLVLSSALGTSFGNSDGYMGLRIYTASLDPTSKHYVGKILNTDPGRFQEEQHLLYGDFAVESEIAKVAYHATSPTVAVLSGSTGTSASGGDSAMSFRDIYGSFNTRYQAARTTSFISQPFGDKEYDLFHFEMLDDGTSGNEKVKISISNLRRSTNPKYPYGTFTVLVRDFSDTDTNMRILEQYPMCSLDPSSEDYIANKIGDMKVFFNFDAETESERRLNVSGKRPNRSTYVRIQMNSAVEEKEIPDTTLPFGFRGLPVLKTTDSLADSNAPLDLVSGQIRARLSTQYGSATKLSSKAIANLFIFLPHLIGCI